MSRRSHILLGTSCLIASLVVFHAGEGRAESLVDVCSGLSVDIPVLQPVTTAATGLLGGALDTILGSLAGGINVNLVDTLSGKQIGATVKDKDGNLVGVPGDCGVTAQSLEIDNAKGVSIGGGKIDGLGGTGNTPAVANDANAIALGNAALTDAEATNAVAIGLRGTVSATDGVAIGRDTEVTADGGVALGSGSVAGRAGMNGGTEAFSGTAVASTSGALSVGTTGQERQITNVAGGTQDTDAINLRQLRAVNDSLTEADDQLRATDDELKAADDDLRATDEDLKATDAALKAADTTFRTTNTTIATALGGGATYNTTTGVFTGPTYTLRGGTYTDLGSALEALDNGGTASAPGMIAADNTAGAPNAIASGQNALSAGYGSQATGTRSTAYGTGAVASGTTSTALGDTSRASATNATAVGSGATAAYTASTAVGAGARTTRSNQVAIGTSASTYTMPGLDSEASRAAQSGPVRVVTSDASGNLATSDIDLDGMSNRIDRVERQAASDRKETRRGIAAAMAMAAAVTPSAVGKTAWAANVAAFHGEMAASFSLAHRLDVDFPLTINGAVSASPGETPGVRLGMAGEF